jgi:glutathione peroxidase
VRASLTLWNEKGKIPNLGFPITSGAIGTSNASGFHEEKLKTQFDIHVLVAILPEMKMSWILALLVTASSLMAESKLQSISLKDINGKATSLKEYDGKVLLVVNVASKCGLTPQYKALEGVHQKYKDQGFTVLGFPCNDFGSQEPGSNEEIKEFCSTKYNVSFPMFDKLHVKGAEQHPLYTALSGKDSPFPGDVKWNFGKFLIGRDGRIIKRFEPKVTPDSPEVTQAIEAALAEKKS